MDKIISYIRLYEYAGLTDQEMHMCVPEIKKRNIAYLNWVLPVAALTFFALFIVSLIPGSGEAPQMSLYLTLFMIIFILYLAFRLFFVDNPDGVMLVTYLLLVTLYGFGVYEATSIGRNTSNTAICVLLAAAPLVAVDTPLRLTILSIFEEIFLLIAYYYVDNPFSDRFTVIESVFSLGLGIVFGYRIQKVNFSDMRNHLVLEKQRDTDVLTGAFSRIAYVKDMADIACSNEDVGIAYVDVNGLKKINDTLGHEAGDKLIKDAYELMRSHFYDIFDRIYRIGGDEFIIVSWCDSKEYFMERLEKLNAEAEATEIVSSGGVWKPGMQGTPSAIKEAERLMYVAKNRYYDRHPENDRRTK